MYIIDIVCCMGCRYNLKSEDNNVFYRIELGNVCEKYFRKYNSKC